MRRCSECEQTQPEGYLRDACYWCRAQVVEVETRPFPALPVRPPAAIGKCEHKRLSYVGMTVVCDDCQAGATDLAYKAYGRDALVAPTHGWADHWTFGGDLGDTRTMTVPYSPVDPDDNTSALEAERPLQDAPIDLLGHDDR